MQLLQAGAHRLILLELEPELVAKIARQIGFACTVQELKRSVVAELTAEERQAPLLLFDAADPANLGWFSRCQFYVDGQSGAVMQTPLLIANRVDPSGQVMHNAIRLQLAKELSPGFRMPGRQPVSEQLVYSMLSSFLNALLSSGVAVCGGSAVKALSGRSDTVSSRN